MSIAQATVYVVDDDPQMRESLGMLIRSEGMKASVFASAEDFIEGYSDNGDSPQCLILDLRMKGMGGLQLQERLHSQRAKLPVIMITGYGDVRAAVQAMQYGAIDFIEKPFNRETLLKRIETALNVGEQKINHQSNKEDIKHRIAALTVREKEMLEAMIAGYNSKKISTLLGISIKTVLKHRARVLTKMGVSSLVELVHVAYRYGLVDDQDSEQQK